MIDYEYGALKTKRIRIKNCVSEFEAKCKLDDYLHRKHGEGTLLISNCYAEDGFEFLKDIFKDGI
jgi:hypothetical protein